MSRNGDCHQRAVGIEPTRGTLASDQDCPLRGFASGKSKPLGSTLGLATATGDFGKGVAEGALELSVQKRENTGVTGEYLQFKRYNGRTK